MGAVPDLEWIVAEALEPTREPDVDVAVHRPAEEGLRGCDRQGQVAVAGDDDLSGAVFARERFPLRFAQHDDGTRLDDGELLSGDRLARRPEHFRVLQPDVRQHLNRRTKDVGRIVASAEPGLDDGDVDARLPRTRRGPRR